MVQFPIAHVLLWYFHVRQYFQEKDDIISLNIVLGRNGYYRSFDKDRKFTKLSVPGLMGFTFSISMQNYIFIMMLTIFITL